MNDRVEHPLADTDERAPLTSEATPGRDAAPVGETPVTKVTDQHSSGGDEPSKPRRRWPLVALIVVVLVAAIAGGIYWYLTRNQTDTDDAYTDGRAVMIAPKVSGYVVTLAVNDNAFVHAGDLLVQIDPRDYTAARDQARGALIVALAQLNSVRVALDKARVDYPAQRSNAEAQLASARAALQRANLDYHRQHAVAAAATTQEQVDTADASQLQAEAQVKEAQAQLSQAQLVDQNIAQAEAEVHRLEGQVVQAQAQLDQANLNLAYTHVAAPQDGWVTRRNVEKGNLLQVGSSIMALVTPDVWVTANFKENQIDRIRPGQQVHISVDAYPELKLVGHVDSIQQGTGSRFSAFPAENATGNFVKIVQRVPVKIDIDSGMDSHRPLPLGLSVTPTVVLK